jgi:prepilin-type N-terminal cleavage/methylation domain-containing protein
MVVVSGRSRGFTLIEMMVAVAVTIVLMMVAIPSFQAFRQRAATRAAAEQVLAVWNQVRLESAKRNTWIKFSRTSGSGNYCVGARVATSATDTSGCDCTQTDTTNANYCDVAIWPAPSDQQAWAGVTLADPTAATALATAVIEPKHAILGDASQAGSFAFVGPTGPKRYKLYPRIDPMGRGVLCQPDNAVDAMSDYATRTCAN